MSLPKRIKFVILLDGSLKIDESMKDVTEINYLKDLSKINDNSTIEIKVKNFSAGEFPKVGGIGSKIYLILGISSMLSSLLYYRTLKNNKLNNTGSK